MSSRDLQAIVKTQKAFIKELLDRLEGKNLEGKNLYAQIVFSIKDKGYSVADLIDLLNDPYFNGLTLEQIFGLAKKSIRLTDDNCKMRHKLEDIKEILIEKDLCVNKDCDSCCNKYSNKIKEILDK